MLIFQKRLFTSPLGDILDPFSYVARVLKKNVFSHMLQQVFYPDVAYVSHIYYKCFIWMLHIFHTHVASVLSECCICFTHMLQVFYLDVVYVSHICCNSMFQNVSFVSDICCIQMFHVVSVSPRHGEWWAHDLGTRGWSTTELGTDVRGAQRARTGSQVPSTRRERRGVTPLGVKRAFTS
jgi:hypothetical protein